MAYKLQPQVHAKRGIQTPPPFFYVDMNANTCIALNSKHCTCVTFNLNASFELDARSIPYLASISEILALTLHIVILSIFKDVARITRVMGGGNCIGCLPPPLGLINTIFTGLFK